MALTVFCEPLFDYDSFFESQLYSDYAIKLRDEITHEECVIPGHKCVFASGSEFVGNCITAGMRETETNETKMNAPLTSFDAYKKAMRFLYSGRIEFSEDMMRVYDAAYNLGIISLRRLIELEFERLQTSPELFVLIDECFLFERADALDALVPYIAYGLLNGDITPQQALANLDCLTFASVLNSPLYQTMSKVLPGRPRDFLEKAQLVSEYLAGYAFRWKEEAEAIVSVFRNPKADSLSDQVRAQIQHQHADRQWVQYWQRPRSFALSSIDAPETQDKH
jgi:hypothetical protein